MARLLPLLLLPWLLSNCVSERDAVLDAARSGNTASRVAAIQKLAEGPWDAQAEDVVVAALTDHSPLVRKTAAAALAGRGTAVAWPLVRRLKDGDLRVRVQVARSLHTLPAEDFVVAALVQALGDPSQMVRAEVVGGFLKRGWKIRELLAWRAFSERLSALEQLTAHSATDQAAGLDQLARLRAPQDFAFLYAALRQTDPFLVQVAAKALAAGGEPGHLDLILEAGGPEPEVLLATWLEATLTISPELFARVRTRLSVSQLTAILQRRAARLTCAWLTAELPPDLVGLLPADCEAPAALPFALRWAYLRHHGRATPELETEALGRLGELEATGLRHLAQAPATRPAILAWFAARWQAYVTDHEKWIPQARWQQLELTGDDDTAATPATAAPVDRSATGAPVDRSATGAPVDRLLDTYRTRSNVVEETELFPPSFDVPGFARLLSALDGLTEAADWLRTVLPMAPAPILVQALRTLSTVSGPGSPLPEAARTALTSEEPEVRDAAASLFATAADVPTLVALLPGAEPAIQERLLEALEEREGTDAIPALTKLFSEAPTARLALCLARLRAPGIRQELQALLAEDTALAMARDRATLLLALALSGPADEAFTQLVRRELWHPDPRVRCAALSLLDPTNRADFAAADPLWEVRRCAGNAIPTGPTGPTRSVP